MILEDHLGDIVRKAREGAGISQDVAAKAAGLSVGEYAKLEEIGKFSTRPNFNSLAELLGLHGKKLEGIADGWLPDQPDVSVWREIRSIASQSGGLSVNCYLVWDEVTREAALFDTGFDAEAIFRLVDDNQLKLLYVFITHSHADHIAALEAIRSRFPKIKLRSGSKNAPPDQRNRANDFTHLGSLRITNRETPGHAEDGVTYVVGNLPEDAPNIAIVGDAIFAGSMGGARQAASLAKQKIKEQIFSLPVSTLICPGHGPLTTVEQEKQHNPFFI